MKVIESLFSDSYMLLVLVQFSTKGFNLPIQIYLEDIASI
jgi:hypothetical protein